MDNDILPQEIVLLDAFFREFSSRYRFEGVLGRGSNALAVRATDLTRRIEVCVKVYRRTPTDTFIQRDWTITSVLKDPNIGDTFTVERFKTEDGKERFAPVSRYYKGKNLEDVLRVIKSSASGVRKKLQSRLFFDIGGRLCAALGRCHSMGYSHGDLSEANVIIVEKGNIFRGVGYFDPVIIDFDNSSADFRSKQDNAAIVRQDLEQVRLLLSSIVKDSKWGPSFEEVIRYCTTAEEMAQSIQLLSVVIDDLYMAVPVGPFASRFEAFERQQFALMLIDCGCLPICRQNVNKFAEAMALSRELTAVRENIARSFAPKLTMSITSQSRDELKALENLLREPGHN